MLVFLLNIKKKWLALFNAEPNSCKITQFCNFFPHPKHLNTDPNKFRAHLVYKTYEIQGEDQVGVLARVDHVCYLDQLP